MMPNQRPNSSAPSTTATTHKEETENQQHTNGTKQQQQQQQPPSPKTTNYYTLTPHAATEIHNFKYSGADLSLLYKYILSPLAQFLVDYATPITVAPNTITLFGFGWMMVSYCIIWYYCPNLNEALEGGSGAVPGWIFLFNCIAMLVYQTLDNMDGKQARRTGSSSPLGLLFDHGCDAANSIIGSANWIAAWGYTPSTDFLQCWVMIFFPMGIFYISTWEEFFTGSLILPIVNGPSEGLLFGASLSLITFLVGVEIWHGTELYDAFVAPYVNNDDGFTLPEAIVERIPSNGIRNNDLMLIGGVIFTSIALTALIIKVARQYGAQTLRHMIPYFVFAICTYVPFALDTTIIERNARTYLHLSSVLFVEMVTQLMLDHVTEEKYNPYRIALVPLVLFTFLIVGREVMGVVDMMNDRVVDDYLLSYTVGVTVYLLCKIRILIHELCAELNIWCFDIVTPRNATTTPEKKVN
mmetsp:Transcript_30711/g.45784  ORF Transcript_30711/g.45784 Transcript_30711/m.45784 type:complete len:468 (-) Transcript_30711:608-2011(-)